MDFSIEVPLPSGKKVRVRELKNSEYLSIIKFAQNNDFEGVGELFDKFFIRPDLNIVDRIYLLIYMRMTFIDPDIILSVNNKSVTVSVASMLDKIESSYVDLETKISIDGIEFTLDLPCITYYDKVEDLITATIKNIQIDNDLIEYSALDDEVRNEILSNLPASVFGQVTKFLNTIQDNLLSVDLIEENKAIGLESTRINLLDNNMLGFICSIYGTDLNGFYTLIYSFQNSIMPGSSFFFDMSPIESRIIVNTHQQRVKDENDRLQKQNQ